MIPFEKIIETKSKLTKILKNGWEFIKEIMVVIIGIYIALLVNKCEDEKKELNNEINVLYNLKNNLNDALNYTNIVIKYDTLIINSIDYILDHIENDLPYSVDLDQFFGNTSSVAGPNIDHTIFQSYLSNNINLIKNDQLKNKILVLYGPILREYYNGEERLKNHIFFLNNNIFNSRFDQAWGTYITEDGEKTWISQMKPNDFELLKSDKQYIYYLKSLKNHRRFLISENLIILKKEIEEVLESIEYELNILTTKAKNV